MVVVKTAKTASGAATSRRIIDAMMWIGFHPVNLGIVSSAGQRAVKSRCSWQTSAGEG
jgi:hypothetical protein